MATKDDWNVLYTNVMPVLGVVVSALGVAVAFLALLRFQPQTASVSGREPSHLPSGLSVKIPRVHYVDGEPWVEVRNPGEWHDIREFVQPTNPAVVRMVREITYG